MNLTPLMWYVFVGGNEPEVNVLLLEDNFARVRRFNRLELF